MFLFGAERADIRYRRIGADSNNSNNDNDNNNDDNDNDNNSTTTIFLKEDFLKEDFGCCGYPSEAS